MGAPAVTLRPTVLSARAVPSALGPAGGYVVVAGTVEHASTCQLVLLSRQSFPVVYSHNPTTACRSGRYGAHVSTRGQPERRKAHRRLRPGGPQRGLLVHRAVLRFPRALVGPDRPVGAAVPSALGPAGGYVVVAGTVEHASTCQLVLLSRQSFPVVYSHNPTTACRSGRYGAHVSIGANPSAVKRTVAFALVARNGAYSSTGRFYVSLGPLLVPTVLSARAVPSALGPAGGYVVVAGTVEHASTCQLVLLSRQSFPVVYSHNPTTACRSGRYGAHVSIGANPSAVKRTVAFALVARNGAYSSTGRFYISLVASPTPRPYTPPPPRTGANPYPAGTTGYDLSWPQCTSRTSVQTKVLPGAPPYAIVGVNNGTIGTLNSCFAAEAAWAGGTFPSTSSCSRRRAGNPSFTSRQGRASCAAVSSECEGYDWGYNYAEADIAFVRAKDGTPKPGGWTSKPPRDGPPQRCSNR